MIDVVTDCESCFLPTLIQIFGFLCKLTNIFTEVKILMSLIEELIPNKNPLRKTSSKIISLCKPTKELMSLIEVPIICKLATRVTSNNRPLVLTQQCENQNI